MGWRLRASGIVSVADAGVGGGQQQVQQFRVRVDEIETLKPRPSRACDGLERNRKPGGQLERDVRTNAGLVRRRRDDAEAREAQVLHGMCGFFETDADSNGRGRVRRDMGRHVRGLGGTEHCSLSMRSRRRRRWTRQLELTFVRVGSDASRRHVRTDTRNARWIREGENPLVARLTSRANANMVPPNEAPSHTSLSPEATLNEELTVLLGGAG